MTEEIGLTCRPRRLQAAKPDRSEHVFNVELRGFEPLTPTLPGVGRSRDLAR
jgi:hypothetical protein